MEGSRKVVCEAGGNWSSSPVCVRLCVDPPPQIAHGKYFVTGNKLNDSVSYSCDIGYQIAVNEPNGELFTMIKTEP